MEKYFCKYITIRLLNVNFMTNFSYQNLLAMDGKAINLSKNIMDHLSRGASKAELEQILENSGVDKFYAQSIVQECLKTHTARKRSQGMMLVLLGGLICLASCVFTLLSSNPSFSSFTLIGLTSLGIIVAFAGLMMIFN